MIKLAYILDNQKQET